MKVRTITISDYDEVVLKALEAIGSARGCRNKEKAYSEAVIRELAIAEECDLDENATALIYYKKENLGTNHRPDWYKKIHVYGITCDPIVNETPRYLVTMSGERYQKDHILAVVI